MNPPRPTPANPDALASEAAQQARAKAIQLANAFEACFGSPKTRSASQKLVLDHLDMSAGEDGNSYRFNEAKDGVALIAAGIHRDGAKSILKVIHRQVALADKYRQTPKPKPKTKR